MGWRQLGLVFALLAVLSSSIPQLRARAASSASRPPLRYGMVVDGNAQDFHDVSDAGFGWIKLYLSWGSVEPSRGSFGNWPDNAVLQARAHNLRVMLLVYDPPGWAVGGPSNPDSLPPTPDHLADFGAFMGAAAAHFRGQVGAYEIWNEPNLSDDWGGASPDPVYYARMLQAAYPRVKAGDPGALVISGGLSNTQNGAPPRSVGDLAYLQAMLQNGGAGNLDGIGTHPYPGACAPTVTSCGPTPGAYFQRAAEQHNLAASLGYGSIPFWITEAGYFSKPSSLDPAFADCDDSPGLGGFPAYEVDEGAKADDLVAAYQYVDRSWPWVGMFMMMNLDFMVDTSRAHCDPVRFWGILDHDGNPSPSYNALKAMPKDVPGVSFDVPPADPSNPSTWLAGTVALDGTLNGGSGIQEVIASVDSPYTGSNRTIPTSVDGARFSVQVDTSHLSYGVTHLVYVYVLTPDQGWISATVGVVPAPQANASPGGLTLSINPGGTNGATATVAIGRNDGNASAYFWTSSSNQRWLAVPADSNHNPSPATLRASVDAASLAPGSYHATITVDGDATTKSWLRNLPMRIPVTVVVGSAASPRYRVFLPNVPGGAVPGGLE